MKNKFLKPVMWFFTLLLILGSALGMQSGITYADTMDDAVTISALDDEGEDVLPLTSVEIDSDAVVYDILTQAADEQDVELELEEYDGLGYMVVKIGNVGTEDEESTYYWSFNTQGKAASEGISSASVKNGDNITFTFVSWEDESDISVDVSALDSEGTAIVEETEVELAAESTAYDALYQSVDANGVNLDVVVDDEMLTSIQGIGEIELDADEYWQLSVNDESLEKSPVEHRLNDGDTVTFKVESSSDEDKEDDESDEPEDDNGDDEKGEDEKEVKEDSAPVDTKGHINDLLTFVDNNAALEYGSEWWIWGLSHTDYAIPDTYLDSIKEEVKRADGAFRSLEMQKIIISLSLLGEDASSVEGYNLIDILKEEEFNTGINGYIYSLIAIDSGQYKEQDGFREKIIDNLLAAEKDAGGWALFGDGPTVDMTAMTLTALSPYQDNQDVKEATDRALNYLSNAQQDNGGFYDEFNGGDSSESVSQVITALGALGIDPTGDKFTEKDGNLLEHLEKFKQDDGGYSHLVADGISNPMASQQALLAFMAYEKYLDGTGSVYQSPAEENDNGDGDDEEETPDNGDEEETPDNEDDKGDMEEPGEDDQDNDDNGHTPTPEDPSDKTPGNDGKDVTDNIKTPNSDGDENMTDNGEKLPKTATNIFNYMLIGLLFVVLGTILLVIKKKRQLHT